MRLHVLEDVYLTSRYFYKFFDKACEQRDPPLLP